MLALWIILGVLAYIFIATFVAGIVEPIVYAEQNTPIYLFAVFCPMFVFCCLLALTYCLIAFVLTGCASFMGCANPFRLLFNAGRKLGKRFLQS